MSQTICVVCSGNICRSPFVEYILKKELGESWNIYSAGTLGIENSSAYEVCCALAPEYNVDLTPHLSQGATHKNIKTCNYILAMTQNHLNHIQMFSPKGEVKLLSEYLLEPFPLGFFGTIEPGADIPDPMGLPAPIVKPVLDLLEKATLEFIKTLD